MIFYTCITNGYDTVPDVYYDKDCQYICFHDGTIETTKAPWKYVKLEVEEECPVRRSYHPKHCPHLYFDEGEYVVWVDAAYNITQDLVEFSKEYEGDFMLPTHPDKRSLTAEFNKLHAYGFSTKDEILDMARLMHSRGYEPKHYDQTINCVIWRRLTPEVIEWGKVWREWYMGGVNRDQVSSSVAEYLVVNAERTEIVHKGNRSWRGLKLVELAKPNRIKSYDHSYCIDKPNNRSIVEFLTELNSIWDFKDVKSMMIKSSTDTLPYEFGSDIDTELIVFTCITNNYDVFPKESYYDPNVKYVCFHDGTIDTTVEPWIYVELDLDIEDPRDFAFYVKANAHEFFPENSYTVWIDGCFILTEEFVKNSMKSFPFSVLKHGGKFSFLDEVIEGYTCAFFSEKNLLNFVNDLRDDGYNFKKYSSPQCTIVWRKLTEDIKIFNERWYMWGNKKYNRDNIPFDAAIQDTGTEPLFYGDRDKCGIKLGFFNKVGRRGKHPQHGDKKQYLRLTILLAKLQEITGLSQKIYAKYKDHEFYMRYFGIISGVEKLRTGTGN